MDRTTDLHNCLQTQLCILKYIYIYININLFQRSDSTYIGSYFHRGGKDNCTWVRGQPKQVVRTRCFKYIDFSGVNVPLQTTLSVRPSVCMSLVRPSDIIVSSLSSCCHSSEPLLFFLSLISSCEMSICCSVCSFYGHLRG